VTTTTLVVGSYGGCTARGVVLRNQAILLVIILRVTYSAENNGPARLSVFKNQMWPLSQKVCPPLIYMNTNYKLYIQNNEIINKQYKKK